MNSSILRNGLFKTVKRLGRQSLNCRQFGVRTVAQSFGCENLLQIQSSHQQQNAYSTLIDSDYIVKSPYNDIHIPEGNLCHHILDDFNKFPTLTALVISVLFCLISYLRLI